MVEIPSGNFCRGSAAGTGKINEQPQNRVTLGSSYMGKYEVTQAQWRAVMGNNPSGFKGDNLPVEEISWDDAVAFMTRLNAENDGYTYRLPTEAEWEYAARGADGREYPWGHEKRRGDLANFADRNTDFAWSDREIDDGFAESSPVGAFPRGASAFGMEDMAGNVWEWCSDFLEAYRGTPKINPRGPVSGAKRIYRGGSWKSRFNSLRATTRGSNVPNYTCNDLGFRIVCECDL
jgi:formylglycine-generating enzyme required for sulfatase activity